MLNKKYFIALLVLIFGLFGYSKYFVFERKFGGVVELQEQEAKSEVLTQPNKFEELTIPYLRSRSYFGELGEKKLYEEKNQYNSYLTSYKSDGLKINGLLTVPKGDMPSGGWPAVVFVHGYIPPALYKTTEKYLEYVDHLAKSGLVVFKIDLRGHGESEGEPGGAYYSADYVIDVLNAYSALQRVWW